MFKWISNLFKPAAELVDNIHTSDEERMELKNELAKIQADLSSKYVELAKAELEARSEVIKAEAASSNWLQSSWRPLSSLALVVAVIASSYGIGDPSQELFDLAKIMLGGYVGGRSLEKVVAASKLGK